MIYVLDKGFIHLIHSITSINEASLKIEAAARIEVAAVIALRFYDSIIPVFW